MSPDDFTTTIASAIGLGDDTDSLAAMSGAISGARLGISAVPRHLLERLEIGPKGRDYIRKLALGLHDRYCNDANRP